MTERTFTLPKKLTRSTLPKLLKKAIKELADGHPTKLASMIEYDYSNLSAVYSERSKPKKLPLVPTDRFCKLIGFQDSVAMYRSQYLE